MGIIKKIQDARRNQKTYRVGLLQSKAYRELQKHTAKLLEPHKISPVEWALLGLLFDNPDGMRLKLLADEVGVEAPFVTQMIGNLSGLGLMRNVADPDDSRAKLACLTDEGIKFVDSTETYLYKEMRPLLKDAAVGDILGYLQVLQKIIENSEKNKPKP